MDEFVIVTWSDNIQFFMEQEGFRENSYLINDEKGLDDFGSSAYFVRKSWYLENEPKLWTIQDAVDGDVLATNSGDICLFDGTVEEGKYPFAYCGLTRYGFGVYDRILPFTHDYVYPATQEQRDLLFQKMKEAGYKWDIDKKELIKL